MSKTMQNLDVCRACGENAGELGLMMGGGYCARCRAALCTDNGADADDDDVDAPEIAPPDPSVTGSNII
jgi:hypothetical protein